MRVYECKVCGNRLYFENSVCVGCGTYLGFSRADDDIVPVDSHGVYVDARGTQQHVCRNLDLSGCTWLTEVEGGQCSACAMTRTRPSDADAKGIAEFPVAERAKRQLLAELDRLGSQLRSSMREVLQLIARLGQAHAVILSTHVLPEIESVCQRVVILSRGRVAAAGSLSELLGRLQRELGMSETLASRGLLSDVEVMRLRRQANDLMLQIQDRINRFRQDASSDLVKARTELAQLEEQMVVKDRKSTRLNSSH